MTEAYWSGRMRVLPLEPEINDLRFSKLIIGHAVKILLDNNRTIKMSLHSNHLNKELFKI